VSGSKAEDEQQLGTTHTMTPVQAGADPMRSPATSGAPSSIPAPGDVISGKYRIEECLGRGGMGMVFRATHLLSEKRVALKWMLRPTSDAQTTGRFVREARAAARVDHANVVDVYDVGEHAGFGYLVMELLRGESLWDRLGRGLLGITEAVDLVLPAMRGVEGAHAAGVIHRDLKPHNVFLCVGPDGVAREAKVLDFGISSFTNADAADPALTLEGTILGTPAYMSPEQLRSSAKLDPRTDVYSMGVILYEALTGRVPFEEPTFTSLVLAIASSAPPAPRSLRPELPPALEQVILRAIARDRDARFADMASFIAALEPFGSELRRTTGPRAASGLQDARSLDSTPVTISQLETLPLTPEPASASPSQDPVPPVAIAPRPRRPVTARAGPRWPGLIAIALIVSVLGWWLARGGRQGVEVASPPATATVPSAEAAVSELGASNAEPSGSMRPASAAAGDVGAHQPPGAGAPAAAIAPIAPIAGEPGAAPSAAAVAAPTPGAPEVPKPARRRARATPTAADAPAHDGARSPPPRGRSGSLSLDDML
jgi:serine/threonine protein kinase